MNKEEVRNLIEDQLKEFQLAVIEKYEIYAETWIEAVVDQCNDLGMEVEDAASMLSPFLIARLKEEGIKLRTVKDDGILKLD
jgi:hypothetical protein